MNLKEAMLIAAELAALNELAAKIQSGDGRWELVQDWLKDRPDWNLRINRWVKFKPEAAYDHLVGYISNRAEIPPHMFKVLIKPDVQEKAKQTIATLQACYRERAGMVASKEIHP